MYMVWFIPFIIVLCNCTHTTINSDGVICIGIDVNPGENVLWNMESIPDKNQFNCAVYFLNTPNSNITTKPLLTFNTTAKTLPADTKGTYSLCISNTSDKPQTLVFSYTMENSGNIDLSDITTISDTERIEAVSKLLLEKTHEISEKLDINKTKEKIYSELSEKMNARILWWSIAHFVVLVSLCITQIYYINSFFEVKTRV